MQVYVFQAALFCHACGEKLCASISKPAGFDADNEHTWDSGDYPKGPYADGGGEADCPQHCDACSLFLENPLTSDGEDYVRDALKVYSGNRAVLEEWRQFYDYL